jgi:hypothetical protein
MLKRFPEERISWKEVMSHPWIVNNLPWYFRPSFRKSKN